MSALSKYFDMGDRAVGLNHEGVIYKIQWGMAFLKTDRGKRELEFIKNLTKVSEDSS